MGRFYYRNKRAFSFKKKEYKLLRFFILIRRGNMPNGKVKWFNRKKGYGFIQPEDGSKDVFVHISAVEKAGLPTLKENQEVSYELVTHQDRTSAGELKLL